MPGLLHRSKTLPLLACCLWSLLSGCNQYAVTLNERPVYEPPALLKVQMVDSHFAGCIKQTVADQGITDAGQLHNLICTFAGITSLEGVEQFKQLQQLDLRNNALTSIGVLAELADLQRLDLRENPNLQCEQIAALKKQLNNKPLILLPAQCAD